MELRLDAEFANLMAMVWPQLDVTSQQYTDLRKMFYCGVVMGAIHRVNLAEANLIAIEFSSSRAGLA